MSWEWEVLAAIVRLLFLLAPFMVVAKDFALGDKLKEATEFLQAASCRAMLVSFPVELFLAILAQASNTPCQSPDWLLVAVYVVGGAVVTFALFKIPTTHFRTTIRPFIWFAVFTALGVLAKLFALAPAVALLCRQ